MVFCNKPLGFSESLYATGADLNLFILNGCVLDVRKKTAFRFSLRVRHSVSDLRFFSAEITLS